MKPATGKWVVAAPFFTPAPDGPDRWLDDFVDDPRFTFAKVRPAPVAAEPGWHSRKRRDTGLGGWKSYWGHAARARAAAGPDGGIITVFPQLALVAAIQKRLAGARNPLVAWCFNVGAPPSKVRRLLGRWAFRAADHVVVHSTREVELVRSWFDIPAGKVSFVPLQKGGLDEVAPEDTANPFILSMGSANRDYATLFRAIAGTGIPLVVVAAERCVSHLAVPSEVTLLRDLSHAECLTLVGRARLSVIPLADVEVASGQTQGRRLGRSGRPVIATRSAGTTDYAQHGETALFVDGGDPAALRDAITALWSDAPLRAALADKARIYAADHFSDQAAGRALGRILAGIAPGGA
ncbi:glycosyltransferase [Sphingomonas humi]|uniref:Glycosyltransferase n=1 Tax=Sphingomonas humi TaxID=335630 RepID=A0ABP7S6L9_9SPHN